MNPKICPSTRIDDDSHAEDKFLAVAFIPLATRGNQRGFLELRLHTRVGFNFIQSRNSTTSAPPVEYEFIEGVEDINQYRLGRYHPVPIDDRLNKQYRVVKQARLWFILNFGTTDAKRRESDIISQIAQSPVKDKSAPDQKLLFPTVLDRFEIIGPNGIHPCLVTPPARCSLRDSQDNGRFGYFQLDAARSLAAQLVMALSIVHERGFAHGEQLYALYGEPDKEPLLGEAKLVLSDFGVAFRPDEKSQFVSHALAAVMRPPELQFEPEVPLTFASDMWSLGYAIFELLAHRTILDEYCVMYETNIIAQQIGLKELYFDEEANSENTVVDYDTWSWEPENDEFGNRCEIHDRDGEWADLLKMRSKRRLSSCGACLHGSQVSGRTYQRCYNQNG
ncbi:hypothetical protein E4U61_005128 [Claviceps capensis]|nr:hypothetical protein E4U61_005128 [Claviceps capensis]